VIDRLLAAGAAKGKGEYETTEQYRSRSEAIVARFGQLTFLLSPRSAPDFKYDADTEEMTANLSAWITVLDDVPLSSGPPHAFMVRTDQKSVGKVTFERGIILDPSSQLLEKLPKEDYGALVSYPRH
jgi:hypothetical protein